MPAREFQYRLRQRVRGQRPGAHLGSSRGAGMEFATHARLYDYPDPRRLDLRASLRDVRGDWLVRVNRQPASVAIHALIDVSASMGFGAARPKLHIAADFIEALGRSAFRAGDTLGMLPFGGGRQTGLFLPAQLGRGRGDLMSAVLRGFVFASQEADPRGDLERALTLVARRPGIIFLVSDFHFPLSSLDRSLDALADFLVVPMIIRDRAELEPPARDGIVALHDSESGVQRTLWMRPRLRKLWREALARRRAQIDHYFARRRLRPFYADGSFECDAMSGYFLEARL